MPYSRRQFIGTTGTALLSLGVLGGASLAPGAGVAPRVGICDWNLGPVSDPELIPQAKEANLDGIQVSLGDAPDRLPLRQQAVRERYLALGREHGIAFPSVAAGSILNQIPLKSEPQAAVFVVEAIEAAVALEAEVVLLAFFSAGDLRLRDEEGNFIDETPESSFSTYRLDEEGVERVVAALRQLAPRAEDAGVVLGLENTLTAEQNLELIEAVGSDAVEVYYDVGNSEAYGYDVPGEIRRLGSARICEMHLKETLSLGGPDARVLGAPAEGGVDFEAAAAACRDIGYDKWFVLETGGREDRFLEDTRANVAFAERVFSS